MFDHKIMKKKTEVRKAKLRFVTNSTFQKAFVLHFLL